MEFDIAVNEVEQEALKVQSTELINQNFLIFDEFLNRILSKDEGIRNNFNRMWELCMECLSATAQFYEYSLDFAKSYKYFCDEEVKSRLENDELKADKVELYENLYNDIQNKFKTDLETNEALLKERVTKIFDAIKNYHSVILENGDDNDVKIYKDKLIEVGITNTDYNDDHLNTEHLHVVVFKISQLMELFVG